MSDDAATATNEATSQEGAGSQEPRNGEPTDAPLGAAGERALEAWKQRAKDAERAAREAQSRVQQFEDANKSELEKLTGKLTKAEQRAVDAESRLLRFEVAAEKQIPADAVDLLTGSTREELEAKAEKLLALVQKPEATPDFDGGAREPAPAAQSPEEEHNQTFLAAMKQLSNR